MKRSRILMLLIIVCLVCATAVIFAACDTTEEPQPPAKHAITFVVDDNTYATVETAGNEMITMPTAPNKDGYTFDGWYLDNGTWQSPFTAYTLAFSQLNDDITVYAKFYETTNPPDANPDNNDNPDYNPVAKYTLKFIVDETEYFSITTSGSEVLALPTAPAKDDYTFDGWYWDNESWRLTFNANSLLFTPLLSNTAVYAHFIEKVDLSNPITPDEPTLADGWKVIVDATCTTAGQMERVNPETNLKETRSIAPLGHVYGEFVVTEFPTCSAIGNKIKTCLRCRDVVKESIAKLEHIYGEWVITRQPTCSEEGNKQSMCSLCKTIAVDSIPTIAHTYGEWVVAVQPTCSMWGTETLLCAVCNAAFDTRYIETVNHTFNENAVCSVCNFTNLNVSIQPNNTVMISGFKDPNGISDNLVIPKYYQGYLVQKIESAAFRDCRKLTSVTIPDSVIYMGSEVFSGCSNLKSLTIPYVGQSLYGSNYTHFGYLFTTYDAWYQSPYIPKTLKSVTILGGGIIPFDSFYDCANIESVTLGNGVTSIGHSAFHNCSGLKNLIIPDSVQSIGSGAFDGCTALDFSKYDNALYLGNADNPYYVLLKAENTSINICRIYENCKIIYDAAFKKCDSLTSLTIPDSIISIGNGVFDGCNNLEFNKYDNALYLGNSNNPYQILFKAEHTSISTLVMHENCRMICDNAFRDCYNITNITIPTNLISVGENAFCQGLTSINYMGDLASWCKISGLNYLMSNSCTLYINNEELVGDIVIPDTISSISISAFKGCKKITSVVIPDNVISIGGGAFSGCSSLASVKIGNNVTIIDDSAFYGCISLTSITIPDSVISLGYEAFRDCSSLASIIMGSGVTSIGTQSFYPCIKLETVYYKGTENDWWQISFGTNSVQYLFNATRYYYSESEPTEDYIYWHYDENGEIVIWEKWANVKNTNLWQSSSVAKVIHNIKRTWYNRRNVFR